MVGRYIGHHEPHFIIDLVQSAAAHPRPTRPTPPTPPVLNGQPPPSPLQDTKRPTTRSLQSHRITSSITRPPSSTGVLISVSLPQGPTRPNVLPQPRTLGPYETKQPITSSWT